MKALLSDDYVIIEAADGNEALKMARTFHPDLVISDVMMPGIDGLELCAELKRNSVTSQIPVIIVSAKALDEQKIEGYENGADSLLSSAMSSVCLLSSPIIFCTRLCFTPASSSAGVVV